MEQTFTRPADKNSQRGRFCIRGQLKSSTQLALHRVLTVVLS